MLPANSTRPPRAVLSAATDATLFYALFVGALALLLYSVGVGVALLSGGIDAASAYLWMVPVPLALAFWYGFGFARESDRSLRDGGLLVSALGWLSCALCLLSLHAAGQSALRAGLRLDQMTPSPLSWLFAALAIAGIAGGAWLSWQFWQQRHSDSA